MIIAIYMIKVMSIATAMIIAYLLNIENSKKNCAVVKPLVVDGRW